MKVVHVCMQHYGGAGTAAYRLHRALLGVGVESSMCVLNRRGDDSSIKVAVPQGGGMHALPGENGAVTFVSDEWIRAGRRWRSMLDDYPARPGNLEIFTDVHSGLSPYDLPGVAEADVVHLHWVAGMIDWTADLGPLVDKPVVWTLHDMNAFTGGCHYSAGCERWREGCGACPALGSSAQDDVSRRAWDVRHRAYADFDPVVVTPSRWLGRLAAQSPLFAGRRVEVIPNGLDTEQFRPWPADAVRSGVGLDPDSFVILFGAASVHNHRKGFRQMVRTLEALKTECGVENAVLVIFGQWSGGEPDLPYPVMEFGYMDDEMKLAAVYSLADVFLLPSLEDNLPSVALESLACGTPVAAFDVGGMGDMIVHRETGWLAQPYDALDLAKGLVWARAMRHARKGLAARCRATVLEHFTAQAQARAHAALYRSILMHAPA
ncbi:glycosyltransferase involved in cell wall biosynthesis [Desulfobaculum xiamenense]|uniref:Glycosyltransferase involved in cell wall biosynthesis n=1 Tax=Desulfobaculum xiamenense TaxID=995050 RepID=A0A846QLK4_9BACT|nr:glycosyltransferase family 4 protein [Desulfobaculum xiamenense]NJB67073.1 glycosyltransferase involved in cell wall biosynthesis [Desulfobaculum xiamenense]